MLHDEEACHEVVVILDRTATGIRHQRTLVDIHLQVMGSSEYTT